jgi:hypothetical protein
VNGNLNILISTMSVTVGRYCRAYVATIYMTGIGLTTGFIGSHTVTYNYSVYTLQLTTVHYNTCRVSSLTLLYSEDSLSANY